MPIETIIRTKVKQIEEIMDKLIELENGITKQANDCVWMSGDTTACEFIYNIIEEYGTQAQLEKLALHRAQFVANRGHAYEEDGIEKGADSSIENLPSQELKRLRRD